MHGRWWLLAPVLLVAVGVAAWLAWRVEPGDEAIEPVAGIRETEADTAAFAWGTRFLDESIGWLERESHAAERIESFHCLLDAKLEQDTMRLEGALQCWFRAPGGFRLERASHGGTTTTILAGDRSWRIHVDGRVEDLLASPAGRDQVAATEETRDRLVDVVSVIALRPLRQGSARFRFEGYKRGSGTYAGNWVKVARVEPGTRRVFVWIAYDRTGENEVHATWPGVVRIEDVGERGPWIEDWILKQWDSPLEEEGTGRRFPRRIEAYEVEKDEVGRTVPRRFLFAVVDDLEINEPVDDDLFAPPQ